MRHRDGFGRIQVDWPTFWTALSAVGQITAAILAAAALLISLRTFSKSLTISHYAELDRMYGDLLKLAIEMPHLRDPNANRMPEQIQQYHYFAHLSWCVVEAIFDRASSDNQLLPIWHSAIEIENRLHRDWFDRPENAYMFRKEFRDYITKHFPRLSESVVAAGS